MTTCSPLFIKSTRTSNSAARDKSEAIDWPYFGFVVREPPSSACLAAHFCQHICVFQRQKCAQSRTPGEACQAETLRPICICFFIAFIGVVHRIDCEPYIS